MINLVVAGGGEGTYKTLLAVTKALDPNLRMKIGVVIDIVPKDKLHPKTWGLIEREEATYIQASSGAVPTFDLPPNAAGIVMTPNDSHLWYADFFSSRGIPTYVEKPIVTNLGDLEKFLEIALQRSRLLYCAEYCVDGKGFSLLWMSGIIPDSDPRCSYLRVNPPFDKIKMKSASCWLNWVPQEK